MSKALQPSRVSCVMAGDEIPADLCASEQGGALCVGCTAPTRRCTSCRRVAGIVDGRRGLCGNCMSKRQDSVKHRTTAHLLEEASLAALDMIERMDAAPSESPVLQSSSRRESPPAEIQPDLDRALNVLAEHGVLKPSGQYVPNPERVLALRFGLLPNEANATIERLQQAGMIEPFASGVWRFIVDVREQIERRDRESVYTGRISSRDEIAFRKEHSFQQKRGHRRAAQPPPQNPLSARGADSNGKQGMLNALEALKKAAQIVDGIPVVRGAVPLLTSRLRITTAGALAILERLEADERILQNDEWRSITLAIKEEAASKPSVEPPLRAEAPARVQIEAAIKAESSMIEASETSEETIPASVEPVSETKPPRKKSDALTIGVLFDSVAGMSVLFAGERVARSVVPTLSSRLKLGVPDVISALERLEQQGAILRKDGWRTVAVLAERVEDDHPVKPEPEQTSKPRPARPSSPTTRARAEKLRLQIVDGEGSKRSEPDVQPRVPKAPAPSRDIEQMIAKVETTLRTLRSLRDRADAKAAILESSLVRLRQIKSKADEAKHEANLALEQAEETMKALLELLRASED